MLKMKGREKKMGRRSAFWLVFSIALLGLTLWSVSGHSFRAGQAAPEISSGPWVNSAPLTINDLRGRVVLVEFWTYG